MTTAWTKAACVKTVALALLMGPLACIVSIGGDGDDDDDGIGGSFGSAGRGATGGTGGSDTSGNGGDSLGGSGGTDQFPAPTCEAEAGDEDDPCVQCFKRSCCTEWVECADQSCTNEWTGVADCMTAIEFATADDLGMCISTNSEAGDDFVQANTQALIDCATTPTDDGVSTLCSTECFGSDVFFD